jgi:hypothetical protein
MKACRIDHIRIPRLSQNRCMQGDSINRKNEICSRGLGKDLPFLNPVF